jgi:hypothetical protein
MLWMFIARSVVAQDPVVVTEPVEPAYDATEEQVQEVRQQSEHVQLAEDVRAKADAISAWLTDQKAVLAAGAKGCAPPSDWVVPAVEAYLAPEPPVLPACLATCDCPKAPPPVEPAQE